MLTLPVDAQELRVQVTGAGELAVTPITPKLTFKGGLLDGVSAFGFGGWTLDRGKFLGGVGLEKPWRVSDNATLRLGIGAQWTAGRKGPGMCGFVGIEVRGN